MQVKLSELYFGELEAFDEARNNPSYFSKTFVVPESISIASLRKNNKFIIVGRKGVGKTALQMYFAENLQNDGYRSAFFRFSDDMRADDFTQLSKTQTHITYVSATNEKNLFMNYDFRDVWERIILTKIAEVLEAAGVSNKFTNFVRPKQSRLSNIFFGLTKNLTLKLSGDALGIAVELGLGLEGKGEVVEVSIGDFNRAAKDLFLNYCRKEKLYFFIDELVFSRLDAEADQVTVKAAMVRDIIKTARELNSYAVKHDLDLHFICSLRPEIRNLINEYDSEIGKIVDGKDVNISWYIQGGSENSLLLEIFKKKIENSVNGSTLEVGVDFKSFVAQKLKFGQKDMSLTEFIKTNTWGRPRDLVRLLNSIQKGSPNAGQISEEQFKAGLDDYSRASAKELIDELSVTHGKRILEALRKGICRKVFQSKDEFLARLPDCGVNETKLFDELFHLGVIGGFQKEAGNYFWAHRGDSYFKDHWSVRVHPALWNEFGIRST